MKRLIVLSFVIFFAVSGLCFAQGFEIGASGFLASSTSGSVSGGGLNIAGTRYFTDTIGYGLYGNIMYGTKGNVSIIAIDMLAGITFKIVKNKTFALPLAIGLYSIRPFAFSREAAVQDFNAGAGGNITAEIKLSGNAHLYLRLQAAYEILGTPEFMFIPSIGIGL